MTARNQKRKAVEQLTSQDLETPIAEKNQIEPFTQGPRKYSKTHLANLDEMKMFLREK